METLVPEGYQETKLGIIPNDWEVKTFQSIFERVTRKNTVNNQNVLTISAQHGLVNQEDFFNKSVSSEDLSGYILLNKGEFAYNKSYSNGYPMGAIKRLKKYDQGVVSSLYIYFKAIKDDPEFYEHYFEAGMLNREIYKIAQEGARNHGLLNMSVIEFFKDLHVAKPPKIEQQKIAQILTTWDKAIVEQEKLIKEKVHLKKGLMQKLLSGEICFDGFNDESQEFKLGELFAERNKRAGEEEHELLAVTMANGVVKRDEVDIKDNSSNDKSNYKQVKINDIAYNTMRMWQGASGVSKYNGIVSPAYTIVYLKKDYDIDFFGYLFKTHRVVFDFYRYSQGLTSDTWNIKYPHFSEVKVKIPTNKKEQLKIVEVLKKSEEEINLLKNELEELKLQKKALMQKLLTGEVRVKV